MTDVLATLCSWLEAGYPVVSATIAAHEGSTPRGAGSKMIVRAEAPAYGTVGGGLVEARVLEAAAGMLAGAPAAMIEFNLSGELAAGADMICGGALRVFLEKIEPRAHRKLYAALLQRLERGERCVMALSLDGERRVLVAQDGSLAGTHAGREMPEALCEGLRQAARDVSSPRMWSGQDGQWFLEPWSAAPALYLAGAGHVARAAAQVAALAGFRVTVLDDRPEFANRERFAQAHDIRVVDLGACLQGLPAGPRTSIVIVTRGHVHDADVLAQALRTDAGFIGMIGSRRKRDSIYLHLRAQGFSDADFARVHCPVGLAIGAETPEEIAVSIVAQLIAFRALKEKG